MKIPACYYKRFTKLVDKGNDRAWEYDWVLYDNGKESVVKSKALIEKLDRCKMLGCLKESVNG